MVTELLKQGGMDYITPSEAAMTESTSFSSTPCNVEQCQDLTVTVWGTVVRMVEGQWVALIARINELLADNIW